MARRTTGQRNYIEKLRDPRWQRRRLAVLERAGWRCEGCGTNHVNLQIHHGFYERDADPWDYPDGALFCVCDSCHERAEAVRIEVHRELGFLPPWHQHHAIALLQELRRALENEHTFDWGGVERSG